MSDKLMIPAQKPTSVGIMLKQEFLDPMGITQGALAKAMKVSRKTVNELCGDKRGVTAETAFLLGKVLGTTPQFWLNLQYINDLWYTKNNTKFAAKLEEVTQLVAA